MGCLPTKLIGMVVVLIMASAVSARAGQPLSSVDEINAALAAAKPGDTVVIADGVYTDAQIAIPVNGEEGKPVTLAPQTPGKVVFTGTSHITLTGDYLHVTGLVFEKNRTLNIIHFQQASHGRLSHCAFNESGDPASTFTKIVEIAEGSHDNEVDHCYFAKSLSMSVGVRAGALRNNVRRTWFRDIVALAPNGQEAIQLGGPVEKPLFPPLDWNLRSIVEHNLFDGACGDEEIISIKSHRNVIRGNTFLAHPTANKGGLNVRYNNDNLIEGNYFIGVEKGIRVSGARNTIVNNYIEGGEYGLRLTAGGTDGWAYLPAKDNLIAHNTIVGVAARAVEVGTFMGMKHASKPDVSVHIYPSGNRIYNNVLIAQKQPVITDTRMNTAPPEENANDYRQNIVIAGSIQDAVVKQDDRYRPSAGGPAEGQGVPIAEVSRDIEGRTRPRDVKPTIGCDELYAGAAHSVSGVFNRRLTPKDVGPDWMKGDPSILSTISTFDEKD